MEASISPAAACGLEWTQNRAKACVLSVGDGQLAEVAAVTHRQKAKITVEMSGRSPSSTSGWRCAAPRWRAAFSRAASTTGRAGTPPPCRRSKFARRSRRWWRPPCARGYDLLGLSALMRQRYPAYYEAHRENWGEALASCGYNVAVSCEIDRTGAGNR